MSKTLGSKAKTAMSFLGWSALIGTVAITLFAVLYLPMKQVDLVQEGLPLSKQLSGKEKAELVDRYRSTLIGGVGTFATALGGIFLFLNFRQVSNKNANDKRLAESRLTAEQFTKAAEFLGSKNLYTQLCGIYSLEKLAEEFPKAHYWSVIETLTTFVREESYTNFVDDLERKMEALNMGSNDDEMPYPYKMADRAKVALEAIQRVKRRHKGVERAGSEQIINLSSTNLRQANLRNADLRNAYLRKVFLYGADLRKAELEGADLSKAYLREADLRETNLNGTNLSGACLRGANLSGVDLRETDLSGADLIGADLKRAQLGKDGSKLKGAIIGQAQLDTLS